MEFIRTKLEEVMLIKPKEIFEDFRGRHRELYDKQKFIQAGLALEFVQEDCVRSAKNILRGLHGDRQVWKLASCLQGKVYFVVVDCREGSSRFGEWEAFTLSDTNHCQVLVPPGCASGHLALADDSLFFYKQSGHPVPENQFSHRFNDPKFKVWWPLSTPLLSRKDEKVDG